MVTLHKAGPWTKETGQKCTDCDYYFIPPNAGWALGGFEPGITVEHNDAGGGTHKQLSPGEHTEGRRCA